MSERTNRQADSAHPIDIVPEPEIKVTRDNLELALKILRQVLDEEMAWR